MQNAPSKKYTFFEMVIPFLRALRNNVHFLNDIDLNLFEISITIASIKFPFIRIYHSAIL